ncbi:restriction endonuclease subunit S [Cellulomonas aerilata]|uniref:Type I restriction modification DNA specificity domain-containing protein n=1 Tax=Cellulomonas aerilata TaxID=515326 RepID=A0A512D772_9CELL|nr:restriction endonuclease subunit S [Cellulomonas aerilata]GEO32325.1 hypothetical protein CAE01nite_00500 [Cellulomonas aerilata]
MSTWKVLPLGKATISLDWKRVPVKASERVAGPYPYYGASGIVDHVDGFLFDELSLLVSEDGENLRSRKTPIAFLANGKYWVNNHAHVLRAATGHDIRFIHYAMQVTDISGYLTGSTQPKLTAGSLAEIPLNAPALEEQQHIADLLSAMDGLIAQNRALIDHMRTLATELVGLATRDTSLGSLSRPYTGKQIRPLGPTEHYSLLAFDNEATPDLVDGESIKSGKLPLSEPMVLVSRLNPKTARSWMVYPGPGAVCSTEFVPLLGDEASVEEIWAATARDDFWDQMRSRVTGTTGSHQRVDREDALSIAVPDVRTLAAHVREEVVRLVRGIQQLREEIESTVRARDELLPHLVAGTIEIETVA